MAKVSIGNTTLEEWLDVESDVPLKVQRNFAKLLEEHPEGINITNFSKMYKKKYGYDLIATHYEATSLLVLVGNLENIFRLFEVKGEDVILFPAFLPESESEIKLRSEVDTTPEKIKENMKKLLITAKYKNPVLGGIYYEDFLDQYKEKYGTALNFKLYNSSTFGEFIKKQMKTWLMETKDGEKSILYYYNKEEDHTEKLYSLNLIQKVDRCKFPADVISPHEYLKTINFQEEFKVGDKFDVAITKISSCDRLYMQLKKYADELTTLEEAMYSFYNIERKRTPVRLPSWVPVCGVFCATYLNINEWFRVQILEVCENKVCKCYYVDDGRNYNVKPNNLYYLKKEFSELPMQAICSSLAYCDPIGSTWDDSVLKRLSQLTSCREVIAEIVEIDPLAPCLKINLYVNGKNLLDILVAENLAKRTNEEDEEYFEVKEENIVVPSEIDTSPLIIDELNKTDNSPGDEKLLNNIYSQHTIPSENFHAPAANRPHAYTPPPFDKTKSMPTLFDENKIGGSSTINGSLNIVNESQLHLQLDNLEIVANSMVLPPRSNSTPAVVQNFSDNQFNSPPPSNCFSKKSSSPPLPAAPPVVSPNPSVSSSVYHRYPPVHPYYSYSPPPPVPLANGLPYYPYLHPMPYPTGPIPNYMPYYNGFHTGFPNPHPIARPPGFPAAGSPLYYQPQYPWMAMNYFHPPHNGVHQAPCPPGFSVQNNYLNMNHALKECQKMQESKPGPVPQTYCLPNLSEITILNSNTPGAVENNNGNDSVVSSSVMTENRAENATQRRPNVQSTISNVFNQIALEEQKPIQLEIKILDLNIFGQAIHKVVLNNKVFIIEGELIAKLSPFVDNNVLHKEMNIRYKFEPTCSQYPLLFEELKKKKIGVSLKTLVLIPINEFPRWIYEAGITAKEIMHEALVERIDLRFAMWSNDFDDFSNESKRKRRKIDPKLPASNNLILKEPSTVEELITHSKKISEVRDWLEHVLFTPEILLISGPAGSAKSITLKTVAQSMDIEVLEWINPVDKQEFNLNDWFEDLSYEPTAFKEPKQLEKFELFAFRSSRYQTLFSTSTKQIILVEDYPNHFIWKPNFFVQFLSKYKKSGLCPIVFICTDDEKFNLLNTLFPNTVKECFNIHNIKFNPVSYTALLKMLQKTAGFLPKETLIDVAKKSNGDIRTALTDLKFLVSDTSKKKKGVKISKDHSTDFFQTLGRVLYPKRNEEQLPTGQVFLYDVQIIGDHYNHTFLSMIHENFLNTFTSIKDATKACERLSDCDIFNNGYDELQCYAGLTCVIGVMAANKHPKKGSFQPMSRSKIGVKKINNEQRLYPQFQLTNRSVNLDLIPYLKLFPNFAGSIMNAHADRLWTKNAHKKENVFKLTTPALNTESDEEWTIEEFND